MTKDKFITFTIAPMGDLSKNFSRYEMVDVAIKFFRRIGIAGEHSGSFIYLDIDPKKNAGRYLDLLRIEKTPLTRSSRGKGEKGFNLLQV